MWRGISIWSPWGWWNDERFPFFLTCRKHDNNPKKKKRGTQKTQESGYCQVNFARNPGFGFYQQKKNLVYLPNPIRCQVYHPVGHTTVPFVPQFSSRPWLRTTTLEQGGCGCLGQVGLLLLRLWRVFLLLLMKGIGLNWCIYIFTIYMHVHMNWKVKIIWTKQVDINPIQ